MPQSPARHRKPRTELKEFEHDMSGQLAAVGKEMAEKYDLSEETAKAKSVGVKGFRSHKLLDAKGYAKLGGMQRDGRSRSTAIFPTGAATDIVSLSVLLLKDQPIEAHEFHVIAPAGPARWRKAGGRDPSAPRPKRRSSPPTAGSPSRICRALPRRSTRRWRRSRLSLNRHSGAMRANANPASDCLATWIAVATLRNDEQENQRKQPCPNPQNASFSSPVRSASPRRRTSASRIARYRRPGAGEVLLRTIWLSLDPYMRGRMSDGPSYAAPVPIGGVMEGGTVSEVIASNNPGFAKGDIVLSRAGWQTHALSDGKGLAQDRSEARADLDRGGRARHARHDRLYRPARYRQAAGRRNRGGRGGLRRGRLGGRADREDQGRARGRHRRRQGQMRLRQEGARLRRLPRSPRSRSRGEAEGGLPEGHRRLFRECRRRGVRGGVSAAQRVRAHAGLRPDRASTTISARRRRNGPAR